MKEMAEYKNIGPIIDYLLRLVEVHPEKVVDTILHTPISKENSNQQLVEYFLRLLRKLPSAQLAKVIPKMEKEGWVILLAEHSRRGFWYKDSLKTLYEAGDYENLLRLAKNILAIRKDRDKPQPTFLQSIFYLDHLPETEVFNYLADIHQDYLEKALALIATLVTEIITSRKTQRATKEEKTFAFNNERHLLSIDIFKLDKKNEESLGYREISQVILTMKTLIDRLINANNPKDIARIYNSYIRDLPESQLTWRFKLYVMSRSPKILKSQFKEALFRLFKFSDYSQILQGAEYLSALKVGFSILSKKDKRQYVEESLNLFSEKFQENNQDVEDINEYFKDGSHIFSMIEGEITESEKSNIEKEGFVLDPHFEPQPYVSEPKVRSIEPIKPMKQEDFAKLSIEQIIDKLHKEWSPQSLRAIDGDPRGMRLAGIGELLKVDIPKRLGEYIDKVHNFFNPPSLDLHYTYSFLCGIEDAIKQQDHPQNINWNRFIGFLIKIKRYYERLPSPEKQELGLFNFWYGDWPSIVEVIADIVKRFLNKKDKSSLNVIQPYRPQLLEIIKSLLSNPDPATALYDETLKDIKTKVSDNETLYSKYPEPIKNDYDIDEDPFTQALNSIRGKGFETLMSFIQRESERFDPKEKVRIADDIKELFETTIDKERSRALMFMFGHFFPDMYYRDTEWAMNLLPKIFPREENKQSLYTAAWEGYLSNGTLYREVFFEKEVQKLYFRGLELRDKNYLKQRPFQDPNKAIAQHLGLALLHYENFGFEHPLFKKFWKKNKKGNINTRRQKAFINFLGRHFVSGNENQIKQRLEKEPRIREQLKKFWCWCLNKNKNPELFKEFGFWINPKNKIFETKWLIQRIGETLKETKGILTFDYWLEKSILEFVRESPVDTIKIIDPYLSNKPNLWINRDIWFEALAILHKNEKTRSETIRIIDDFISKNKDDPYLNKKLAQITENNLSSIKL